MKRLLAITALLLASLFALPAQTDTAARSQRDAIYDNIDSYARKVRKDWNIPGYALAVIKDGEVVLAKGYGEKMRGKKNPVDANTVFQIGSVSKSFTAALMSMMVDEGKVRWEDKVKDILPEFELFDKEIEAEVEVRDLMTHKLGFRSQVGTYFPNAGYDRDDVMKMMSLVEPVYGLRERVTYNNMSFLWAMRIIENLSGMSWEENLRIRIFEPLGMTSASCNGEGFLASENVAAQYDVSRGRDSARVSLITGEGRALHWLGVVGPAGGINCSVSDLAKWAEFHRNMGIADGTRIISRRQMEYLHTGRSITSQTPEKITVYGHCWYVEQNSRYRVYYHTGTTWGHTAICAFVPDLGLSLAVLFSSEVPNGPRFALIRRIIDLYLGAPDKDYSAEEFRAWIKGGSGSSSPSGFTIPYTKAVPQAGAITGRYVKEEPFGDARVSLRDGKLYITVGKKGWTHRLVHTDGNRYRFTSDGHSFPVIFRVGSDGRGTEFEINWGNGEKLGPWKKE